MAGPKLAGVSASRTHLLMGRGIAAFALLLLLQASVSVIAQSPFAAAWWNIPFLWGFLALLAVFAAASVKGKGLVWMANALAALILAGCPSGPRLFRPPCRRTLARPGCGP